MKYSQVFTLFVIMAMVASHASAQYGPVGSPDVVGFSPHRLPAIVAARDSDPGYTSAVSVPSLSPRIEPPSTDPAPPPVDHPVPPPPEGQPSLSVVDQMLGESSGAWPAPWGPTCDGGPFAQAVASADVCGPCVPCVPPRWNVAISALYISRDDPDPLWTTSEAGSPSDRLGTYVPMDWSAGAELRVARRFGCDPCSGGWALEGVFWTLDTLSGSVTRTSDNPAPGSLVSTLLDFSDVSYANPALAALSPSDLFLSAERQRVSRHDDIQNVELNLIRVPSFPCGYTPLEMTWSIGARFFEFEEDWRYASLDEGGLAFGIDPTLEGYLADSVRNTLVGAQVAANVKYEVGNWRLIFRPKVGIYNNRIENCFTGYRGDGEVFAPDPAGYPDYPVSSSTNAVAFLTELDGGLEWQFHPKWCAHLGYRATIVTGIGLADHQIPNLVVDTPLVADIDHNAQLILHGGYGGLTYRF
ncbi:MAG: hypothetical protein HQ582_18015 [Planctomycetes bacterium]|nr:hypothetical protein [Planctomycetota bacterium]